MLSYGTQAKVQEPIADNATPPLNGRPGVHKHSSPLTGLNLSDLKRPSKAPLPRVVLLLQRNAAAPPNTSQEPAKVPTAPGRKDAARNREAAAEQLSSLLARQAETSASGLRSLDPKAHTREVRALHILANERAAFDAPPRMVPAFGHTGTYTPPPATPVYTRYIYGHPVLRPGLGDLNSARRWYRLVKMGPELTEYLKRSFSSVRRSNAKLLQQDVARRWCMRATARLPEAAM